MKTLRTLFLFAAAMVFCGGLCASEVTDKFNELVGKMASQKVRDGQNDRDRDLDEQKNAQQNWMKFVLQTTDPAKRAECCEVMLKEIKKSGTPIETAVWCIRLIGLTGDDSVVPDLAKLATSKNVRVSGEAARALANIPGEKSVAALKKIKSKVAEDALFEINKDRSILSDVGAETEMPFAIPYATDEEVAAYMTDYASLSDFDKAAALANITIRRDGRFMKEALEATKSDNQTLAAAGIFAVEALANSDDLLALTEAAFAGPITDEVKKMLGRKLDKDLDAKLLAALEAEQDAGKFEVLTDILVRRNNAAAKPIVFARMQQADCPIKPQLMNLMAPISTVDDVAAFVGTWEQITDRGQKDRAENIIAQLVNFKAAPVVALRTDKNYVDMYSLLGRVGDDASLEEIRARVFKTGDVSPASEEYDAAAFRAVCNWPNARVVDDLLKIAKDSSFSEANRRTALRAFIRVTTLRNEWQQPERIWINDQQKLDNLTEAMKLAARVEEKRLIIDRAREIRTQETLNFLMKYFKDEELQNNVCVSVVELAHHNDVRRQNREAFRDALRMVIRTTKDDNLKRRAETYLNQR